MAKKSAKKGHKVLEPKVQVESPNLISEIASAPNEDTYDILPEAHSPPLATEVSGEEQEEIETMGENNDIQLEDDSEVSEADEINPPLIEETPIETKSIESNNLEAASSDSNTDVFVPVSQDIEDPPNNDKRQLYKPLGSEQGYQPWSKYLQRAVANVEQTLDKVLQEAAADSSMSVADTPNSVARVVDSPSNSLLRSNTPSSMDARSSIDMPTSTTIAASVSSAPTVKKRLTMQERLAMAVKAVKAGKGNKTKASGSPLLSDSSDISRVVSPSPDLTPSEVVATSTTTANATSPRSSVEITHKFSLSGSNDAERVEEVKPIIPANVEQVVVSVLPVDNSIANNNSTAQYDASIEAGPEVPPSESKVPLQENNLLLTKPDSARDIESSQITEVKESIDEKPATAYNTREELEALVKQTQNDLLAQDSRHQSEILVANEKIDALEKKLKYLAQQEAERAHIKIGKSTGLDKKLAEKEQMIALLMEEGQALSKKELTYMNTIKKLRQEERENQRFYESYDQKLEAAEREMSEWKERAKRYADSERQITEKAKRLVKLENDYEIVKNECERFKEMYNELKKSNLEEETRLQTERIRVEEAKVKELQKKLDDLSAEYKSEKSLMTKQIKDSADVIRRQQEASSVVESDLRAELQTQEFRVEYYRAKTEELSSNLDGGDNQAKYLRKIENLQSQHEIAVENWNTLENSFNAKISSLETDVDELRTSEESLKNKLKSLSTKHKFILEQNQELSDKVQNLEFDLITWQNKLASSQANVSAYEETINNLESELSNQESKYTLAIERLENEKNKAIKDLQTASATPPAAHRGSDPMVFGPWGGSPYGSMGSRKTSVTSEFGMDASFTSSGRAGMGHLSPVSTFFDVQSMGTSFSNSRKTYAHPGFEEEPDSLDNVGETLSEADSVSNVGHPSKIKDSASISTVGGSNGGPSIQLVGKMSTMIRKLEADLTGVRNELARCLKSKDEACNEVMKLMEENEHFKELNTKAQELESKLTEMEARERMTLEMLGEKAERVKELQADVQDLKEMYTIQIVELVDQLNKR